MQRRALLTLAALPMLGTSRAAALEGPEGPAVLSLSGRVRQTNRAGKAVFDMAMIAALPQRSYSTRTPWYSQPRKFTGPLLRDLLAAAGGDGKLLRAYALNDYRVDIPVEDCRQHDMLLARLLDDKPMSVRDKGPLLIIYPFDQKPELRSALYYSRCAWQLNAIEVL